MVRAFAGDSTITRRVPSPLLAVLSLPLGRFAAGGVLAATHSPSSPAPVPGPVLSVARYCFRKPQPANFSLLNPAAEPGGPTLGLAQASLAKRARSTPTAQSGSISPQLPQPARVFPYPSPAPRTAPDGE